VSELGPEDRVRFEQLVLPHLDAAFNLARWLLRRRMDAEDVVQEAMLHARRFFPDLHAKNARTWLLQIVRNSCYAWLAKNHPMELDIELDEWSHLHAHPAPKMLAVVDDDRQRLTLTLEILPPRFREVLVLRELEGCSCEEIAAITATPINAVISSLSRTRRHLYSVLPNSCDREAVREV
jgi:RNA polymerase sigma-70 factor, ECF subfamily